MASNPLIPQGVLNKLRGTTQCVDNPQLNVLPSNLDDDGISIAFEGDASGYVPTLTGAVPSPNPYQIATVTIHLLKTQSLSNIWKNQQETDTTIGDVVVTTDAATLDSYSLNNCTIKGVGELTFNGKSVGYGVMVQGIYYINSSLFNLQ